VIGLSRRAVCIFGAQVVEILGRPHQNKDLWCVGVGANIPIRSPTVSRSNYAENVDWLKKNPIKDILDQNLMASASDVMCL
jgi:hypothetical protein